MKLNVLSIEHQEFSLEEFRVEKANYNLYQSERGGVWEFVVKVSSGQSIIRTAALQEILEEPEPSFEATAIVSGEIELVAGQIISQSAGYDYERGENLSNVYYLMHESLEELQLELIEVTDSWIEMNVSGMAIINGSNGSNPDSKISVRAIFVRDPNLKRGVW